MMMGFGMMIPRERKIVRWYIKIYTTRLLGRDIHVLFEVHSGGFITRVSIKGQSLYKEVTHYIYWKFW